MIILNGYVSQVCVETATQIKVRIKIPTVSDVIPYSQDIDLLFQRDHEPRVGTRVKINLEFNQ